jgi:hypothetical protein
MLAGCGKKLHISFLFLIVTFKSPGWAAFFMQRIVADRNYAALRS